MEEATTLRTREEGDHTADLPHLGATCQAMHAMAERPDTRLWHPFADMAAVRGNELVIAKGEGVWLYDEQGNSLSRCVGQPLVRERRPRSAEIADAVARADDRARGVGIFGDVATPPALELADVLVERAPIAGRQGLLHYRRRRRDRHRGETRAPLLAGDRAARASPRDQPHGGLPRDDGLRDVDRRHRRQPYRLRAARARERHTSRTTPPRRCATRSSASDRSGSLPSSWSR